MKLPRFDAFLRSSAPIVLCATLAWFAVSCESTSKSTSNSSTQDAAPAPSRVDLSNDLTAKAMVTAVDQEKRLVTLRRDDGTMFTVEAGPAVRNLSQISVGDTLRVHYHESLSASLLPPGGTTTPVEGAYVAGRAKVGEKPAGGVGMSATARVKIESVDKTNNIVVFSLDSGELNTVRAQRPEGRAFVQGLKIGDIVQLDYTVATALAIDKL
jgi:hypothetical protein